MSAGGAQGGAQFDALNKTVQDTQAALPGNSGVYSLIVGEAGGTAISDALVQLEQARGDINDALQAPGD